MSDEGKELLAALKASVEANTQVGWAMLKELRNGRKFREFAPRKPAGPMGLKGCNQCGERFTDLDAVLHHQFHDDAHRKLEMPNMRHCPCRDCLPPDCTCRVCAGEKETGKPGSWDHSDGQPRWVEGKAADEVASQKTLL